MYKKKIFITGIIGALFLAMLLSLISAHQWACLRYGDSVPHYTCYSTFCKLCLDDKGYSTSFGFCNKLKSCSFGPPTNDTDPPVLTLFSPSENQIFSSRKVLFNMTSSEPVSISYIDNINGRGRWSRVANKMLDYSKELSFNEGLADITIRAEDRHGNYADVKRKFYVDSKVPKVDTPKSQDDGTINFKFEEANPVMLLLKYGNENKGYGSYPIDLKNCNKTKGVKYLCKLLISDEEALLMLEPYEGETIELWIELKDIAGNIGVSKKTKAMIDLTYPVINNPDSMLKVQGKYALFNMSITEKNLADISYYDNSEKRPRWKKLCTSLKNGMCIKKINFRKGSHEIVIRVADDFGNYAETEAVIEIV